MSALAEEQRDYPTVAEAIFYYRAGLTAAEQYELDLFRALSTDKWIMRVLYLVFLDLEPTDLESDVPSDHDVREDHAEAWRRDWITMRRRRSRLTHKGLKEWVAWKAAITPHLRKPAFQQLWREVAGW